MIDFNEDNITYYLNKGDERAFRYIYDTYYTSLCVIAKGYLSDSYLAESVVGDVIYNLWNIHKEVEIRSSLKNFLIRSVCNRSLNYLKQEYIKRELTESSFEIDSYTNLFSIGDTSPLEAIFEKELQAKTDAIVNEMSEETRKVFLLSRYEQKKHSEIAAILGISENTVKYHIKSALAQLRDCK